MNIRHKRTHCNVENVYAALLQTAEKTYEPNGAAVNVAEQLKKMRETRFEKKPSMQKMADLMGFAGASSYQRYETATLWDNKKFPYEFVLKLLDLWRGKGVPPIDSDEILRLGEIYEFVIKERSSPILLPGVRGDTISRELPMITVEQVQMYSSGALQKEGTHNYVDNGRVLGPRAFRLVVSDRSMEPVFREGDVLTCDPDATVEPGDYVIAKLDSEITAAIRQYRLLGHDDQKQPIAELIPANMNYPKVRLASDAPGEIFAVVTQFTRALK